MNSVAQAIAPALARLGTSALPRLLFVSHERGGGVARHVADLAEVLEGHAEVLLLQPDTPAFVALRWLRSGESLSLWFPRGDWERLVRFLSALGIDRLHFHHVDGLPEAIMELPSRLGCPHDLTLHDFYPACPAYNLADATGRYCGQDAGCNRCLDGRTATWPMSIGQWREAFGALLASADRVIAPCHDAAKRIGVFYPGVVPVVWPHPEREAAFPETPLRVLVPGAMSAVKGLEVLRECAADAAQRALPLHFVAVGFLGLPLPQWPEAPLTVTGEYRDGDLAGLIARQGGDVVFFPAQCPETFSYTLSVALDSGLPIVASDLGAFPERLRGHPGGRLVPWNAGAREMNDVLMSVRASSPVSAAAARTRMTFEDYRTAYMEGFGGTCRGPAIPGALEIDPDWLREPVRSAEAHPLAYLYEDGIVCGKARSREQLRRFAFDPDWMHANRDERFMELVQALGNERQQSARLLAGKQAEIDQAIARVESLEADLRRAEASLCRRLGRAIRRMTGRIRDR